MHWFKLRLRWAGTHPEATQHAIGQFVHFIHGHDEADDAYDATAADDDDDADDTDYSDDTNDEDDFDASNDSQVGLEPPVTEVPGRRNLYAPWAC